MRDVAEVQDVRKAYGGRTVLDDISLRVEPGAFVAVLGRSGAGKTTLLRALAGLDAPTSGRVRLGGVDPRRIRDGSIGVIFQHHNLVARATALDNVLVGALGRMSPWQTVTRRFGRAEHVRALDALERLGLLARAHTRADRLSGGERQRVAVARVLAQGSRFIFADEPVASLDPASAHDVLTALRTLAQERNVVVVCSLHQVEFAAQYARRVVRLAGGRIASDVSSDRAAELV